SGPYPELVGLHRAAMQLDDQRIALPLTKVGGIEEHALNRGAVGALPLRLLLAGNREVAFQRVELPRDTAGRGRRLANGDRPDVAEPRRLVHLEHDPSRGRRHRPSRRYEVRAVRDLLRPARG